MILNNQDGQTSSNSQDASMFVQCPICFEYILKRDITQHVEECLERSSKLHDATENETDLLVQEERVKKGSETEGFEEKSSMVSQTYVKEEDPDERNARYIPLAERQRPLDFDHLIGNGELFKRGSFVRDLLEKSPPPSIILFGPPGCGKTTVAKIVAIHSNCPFESLCCSIISEILLQNITDQAQKQYDETKKPTILLLDEIHQANKKQQELLLPFVKSGILIIIGTTTEEPAFSVIDRLLSRCRVIPLLKLATNEIRQIIQNALDSSNTADFHDVVFEEEVMEMICEKCDGDARIALNLLESCLQYVQNKTNKVVTKSTISSLISDRFVMYDKNDSQHHNIISAWHEASRGSDVDGALYWLGRMIEGGEDPLYIARRLIWCAACDVGLADTQALLYATRCFDVCKVMKAPSCNAILAQLTSYMTLQSKSNDVYLAYGKIRREIYTKGLLIPPFLGSSKTMDSYLPEELQGMKFLDLKRSVCDLREISMQAYVDPSYVDTEEKGVDANTAYMPLEKRAKLTVHEE